MWLSLTSQEHPVTVPWGGWWPVQHWHCRWCLALGKHLPRSSPWIHPVTSTSHSYLANRKVKQVGGTRGMVKTPSDTHKLLCVALWWLIPACTPQQCHVPTHSGRNEIIPVQHEGHLALAVIHRILLFMILLFMIILVAWEAEGSASSIYTAVLGTRTKTTRHTIHS